MYRWIILLIPTLIAWPAFAQSAPVTNGIMANILTQYQSATQTWVPSLTSSAQHIFATLAPIELAWSFLWWMFEKSGEEIFVAFLRKMMGLSFFWAILTNASSWVPTIVSTFVQIGQGASGVSTLSPGDVFDLGIHIANNMLSTDVSILHPLVILVTAVTAILTALSFTVVALSLLISLIESYILIAAGVVLLGFSATRWTSSFAEKYLSLNVAVGIRLMVTYLIVGVGQSLTSQWLTLLSNTNALPFQDLLGMGGASLIYAGLVWQIPATAASLMSGSVNMSLGGIAAGAAAMGGAAAGGVAGGAKALSGAVSGGASSVRGAIQAASAASGAASQHGGGTKGAALAMVNGIGGMARQSVTGADQKSSQAAGNTFGGRLAATINEQSAAGGADAPAAPASSSPDATGASPAGAQSAASAEPSATTGGNRPATGADTSSASNSTASASAPAFNRAEQGGAASAAASPGRGATAASSATPIAPPGAPPGPAPATVPPPSALQTAQSTSNAIRRALQTPNDGAAGASVNIPLKHHE